MARKTEWHDININESTPIASEDTQVLFATEETLGKGYTLIRMIINFTHLSTSLTSGGLNQSQLYAGIAMVSDDAVTAGAFPDPGLVDTTPMSGWLWRSHRIVGNASEKSPELVNVDVGTQRKLLYGTPYLILRCEGITGAMTVETKGFIRVLFKLP